MIMIDKSQHCLRMNLYLDLCCVTLQMACTQILTKMMTVTGAGIRTGQDYRTHRLVHPQSLQYSYF